MTKENVRKIYKISILMLFAWLVLPILSCSKTNDNLSLLLQYHSENKLDSMSVSYSPFIRNGLPGLTERYKYLSESQRSPGTYTYFVEYTDSLIDYAYMGVSRIMNTKCFLEIDSAWMHVDDMFWIPDMIINGETKKKLVTYADRSWPIYQGSIEVRDCMFKNEENKYTIQHLSTYFSDTINDTVNVIEVKPDFALLHTERRHYDNYFNLVRLEVIDSYGMKLNVFSINNHQYNKLRAFKESNQSEYGIRN